AVGAAVPTATARIDRIRSAVSQLAGLIERLLSSTQLAEAQLKLSPRETDLRALLQTACDVQREISPAFEIDLCMPDTPVEAEVDCRLIAQVIANLLSSAVKYSGDARRIDVALDVTTSPAESAVIRIVDRGIGIPGDEIGR
ncbi:sensor histidine kinase KdpD, partial [Bradyrhizobium sp. NBAIM08]|uniref:sensor histidine kinase n=1 Tax=Bradyrhizobium sp. NBAIM08 TaxID=2793815 RepID=UPI00201C6AD4